MKRAGYIFEKIYAVENIINAIEMFSKKKTKRKSVIKLLNNKEHYAKEISEMIKNKTLKLSSGTVKTIRNTKSQKDRLIHVPRDYPDQVVHWALILQIKPIIMKGMYEYSCGSVPGRG